MNLERFKIPKWIWVTVLVLVVLRILLPPVTLLGINWALAKKLESYTGKVSDISFSLHKGNYNLSGIEIKKKNSSAPPILKIDDMQISLAMADLLGGNLNGDLLIRKALIQVVASEMKEKKEIKKDEKKWQDILKVLVPIQIKSFKIEDSAFYFSDSSLKKSQNLQLEKINLTATDIRNRSELFEDSLSTLKASAVLQGHAAVGIKGKIDVLAKPPRFDIDMSVVDFKPKDVNELLMRYVPLDLTKGEMSIYTEVAASHDQMVGYTKIFLKDVDVIASNQYIKSGKHATIELGSAFANWILKNNEEESTAAQIPFKRQGGKFDVDSSAAFWSAVKNKSKELKKGFDNSINLKSVEKEKKSISQR